jgi:hypothetical protein
MEHPVKIRIRLFTIYILLIYFFHYFQYSVNKAPFFTAKNYLSNVRRTLDYLKANLNRAYVNMDWSSKLARLVRFYIKCTAN